VGPSIASGNHVCSPICADFPIAPIKMHVAIIVITGIFKKPICKLLKNNVSSPKAPINPKTSIKEHVLKYTSIEIIAKNNPKSPTLFTNMAFIADLLACIRKYQKLINKYDRNPTPSQAKNSCK
jgi:hypothetical protein